MPRHFLVFCLWVLAIGAALMVSAQNREAATPPASAGPATSASATTEGAKVHAASERLEGEKRFKANCGRCHMAPQKFPPRMMATIIRHMRVRATLTDEDARLILEYMTQ